MTLEAILWYLVLLDSLFANAAAWFFPTWYKNKFSSKGLWKQLPLTKTWSGIYLILVLWLGWALYRMGILF